MKVPKLDISSNRSAIHKCLQNDKPTKLKFKIGGKGVIIIGARIE